MKKIVLSVVLPFVLSASPFVEDNKVNQPVTNANNTVFDNSVDLSQDMKSIQRVLRESGTLEMIRVIKYEDGKTYRIPLRRFISSYFVLSDDKIAFADAGDKFSFEIKVLGVGKYDFQNILQVVPKAVGTDTNITILGESGKIYNFYVYSTDYTYDVQPKSVIYISNSRQEIDNLQIKNLEADSFKQAQTQINKNDYSIDEEIEYATIGEGIEKIKIRRADIIRDFVQKGDDEFKADEIFRDKKFVYFKFDKDNALRKFPVVYRVVDGIDNPVNTRVIGDYIIAETVDNKFTLRFGDDEYVCVRREEQ